MPRQITNPAYYLTSNITVFAGGTGYAVNDVLQVNGGMFSETAQMRVTSVNGGQIVTVAVTIGGSYSVVPSNPFSVTALSGIGANAQLNGVWVALNPGFSAIVHYGTNTSGTMPVASTLNNRELFVDTARPSLYVGNQAGQVVRLTGTLATQDANAVSISGGSINGTPIGNGTPSTGSFSALTLSTATANGILTNNNTGVISSSPGLSNFPITNCTIDGTPIGQTTAASGRFNSITHTGLTQAGLVTNTALGVLGTTVTLNNFTWTGGSIDNAPIGAGMANTGRFTSLTHTGFTATGFVINDANGVLSSRPNLNNITADSLVLTNPTITTGSINNTPVGNTTPNTGRFTSLAATNFTTAGVVTNDATGLLATNATLATSMGGTALANPSGFIRFNGMSAPTTSNQLANSDLVNSSLTIGTTTISLGGTTLNLAGLNTVTVTRDPTSALELATKQYADAIATGIQYKSAVATATTENISLNGLQTIDGVVLVAGNRVLVKDQTASAQNGIYIAAVGAWTRSPDANTTALLYRASCYVPSSIVNFDTQWLCLISATAVLNVDPVLWTLTAAATYQAGSGLQLQGTTFSVLLDTNSNLLVSGNGLKLDSNLTSLPQLSTVGTITTGVWNGTTIAIANGGTGATTQVNAITNLTGMQTAGRYLRSDGTNASLSALSMADATGTLAIMNGGTNATTQAAAITNLTGMQTSGFYLRSNGTNAVLSALSMADATGTLAIANGGTGAATQVGAITNLTGMQTNGFYLRSNGTDAALSAILASDVPILNQSTTGNAATATDLATNSVLSAGKGGTGVAGTLTGVAFLNGTQPVSVATSAQIISALNAGAGSALAVGQGGTGATSFTTNGLLIGNGTSAIQSLAIGPSTYVLTSNGTTASWQPSTGGGGAGATGSVAIAYQSQVFTSNGTFTVPAGVQAVKVTLIGGGGGSGGVAVSTGTITVSGSGGAGAGCVRTLSNLTPGNTITVTVGMGGSAGGAGNMAGGAGSASTITSGTQTITTVSAGGGGAGQGASAGASGINGAGGAATGGDINIVGQTGQNFASAPRGAESPFGFSGVNVISPSTLAAGVAGNQYGGGAIFAVSNNTNQAGAVGAQGIVVFEWADGGGYNGVPAGGTGLQSLTANALLVGNGTNPITLLSPSAASGTPLVSNGTTFTNTTPVGVASGGTGTNVLTIGNVLVGNGASVVTTSNNLFWNNTNNRLGIGTTTPVAGIDVRSATRIQQAYEQTNVVTSALTGTYVVDVSTGALFYLSTAATGNFTFNFTWTSSTIDAQLPTNHSLTVTLITTQGATAFYHTNDVLVDGVTANTIWQGPVAPTFGNANSNDVYAFTIVKTAVATYTVFASRTQFAGTA